MAGRQGKGQQARQRRQQGMNWIRPAKRLAIYLRDGLACCWCGEALEDGASLTLDHCLPYAKGGSNEACNLVTACAACNSSRGARTMAGYARVVQERTNRQAAEVLAAVGRARRRVLDMDTARAMVARRGLAGALLDARR